MVFETLEIGREKNIFLKVSVNDKIEVIIIVLIFESIALVVNEVIFFRSLDFLKRRFVL